MKNIKLLFLLIFMLALTACGQQKKYVSYTVKKGETIRSIAKDNDMKVRDLLRLNPDVSRKPDANTVIIIPSNKKKEVIVTKPTKDVYKGEIHLVKSKETLFSIAKRYNVTVDDLKKINNLTGNNVRIGSKLKIPLTKKVEVVEIPINEEQVVEVVETKANTYVVEKGDTVFNLTRRFNITAEELLTMNPTLKTDGLKLGMLLNIVEKANVINDLFVDDITTKPLNILLMLPYKLNSTTDYNIEFEKKYSDLNISTDFHSGVLMAIDSLKKQGMRIRLKVVDTENSLSKITSIMNATNFDNFDAVIGPLYFKNAKNLASKIGNTPVFAPMYSKSQILVAETSLVKVAPNKKLIEDKLINYMIANYAGENIIITGDAGVKSIAKIKRITARLKSHDSITKVTILKPEKGYIKKDRFVKVINVEGRKNWVLMVGEDNVTTNDVVNNLGVMPKEEAIIQLFSLSNGSHFTNVSNNKLARLSFTYPKEEFIDITSNAVINFRNKYKQKYYSDPTKYAIKGFDVTYDALLRLSSFNSFNEGAKAGVSQRVGTKFEYSKKTLGSTENNGVFLIQYQEDLNLKVLE